MNILCSTDDNYVPYCGVMLTSLFESNIGEDFRVFVLTDGLNEVNKRAMAEFATRYNQSIEIIKVNSALFKDCPYNPATDHVSEAAYYRLAVAEILPREMDRILYLDCDIVVNGKIKQYYDSSLKGSPCGVVRDEACNVLEPYARLGISQEIDKPYFNSGVLLINLEYWREHKLFNKFMEYVVRNRERLEFHDQDTLNGVLRGNVVYMPATFNLQRGFLLTQYFDIDNEERKIEIMAAVKNPVIIHYTGYMKPWNNSDRHPMRYLWRSYLEKSLWKTLPMIDEKEGLKDKFMRVRNEIIWKLGILPRPKSWII